MRQVIVRIFGLLRNFWSWEIKWQNQRPSSKDEKITIQIVLVYARAEQSASLILFLFFCEQILAVNNFFYRMLNVMVLKRTFVGQVPFEEHSVCILGSLACHSGY